MENEDDNGTVAAVEAKKNKSIDLLYTLSGSFEEWLNQDAYSQRGETNPSGIHQFLKISSYYGVDLTNGRSLKEQISSVRDFFQNLHVKEEKRHELVNAFRDFISDKQQGYLVQCDIPNPIIKTEYAYSYLSLVKKTTITTCHDIDRVVVSTQHNPVNDIATTDPKISSYIIKSDDLKFRILGHAGKSTSCTKTSYKKAIFASFIGVVSLAVGAYWKWWHK